VSRDPRELKVQAFKVLLVMFRVLKELRVCRA
jgi:hypothetical protein